MKSRVVLLVSLLLGMLLPFMVLGSSACGRGTSTPENEEWTRQFGTSDLDNANVMFSDGSGNIYVAGPVYSQGFLDCYASTTDFFIAKYDVSGDEVWRRKSHGLGENGVAAIVADESGNIYVAGGIKGSFPGQTSSGKDDAFIMKIRE